MAIDQLLTSCFDSDVKKLSLPNITICDKNVSHTICEWKLMFLLINLKCWDHAVVSLGVQLFT